MRRLIEWFFSLFLKEKAEKVRADALLERQLEVLKFAKVKKANEKYLSKYSGKRKYQKAPKIESDN